MYNICFSFQNYLKVFVCLLLLLLFGIQTTYFHCIKLELTYLPLIKHSLDVTSKIVGLILILKP